MRIGNAVRSLALLLAAALGLLGGPVPARGDLGDVKYLTGQIETQASFSDTVSTPHAAQKALDRLEAIWKLYRTLRDKIKAVGAAAEGRGHRIPLVESERYMAMQKADGFMKEISTLTTWWEKNEKTAGYGKLDAEVKKLFPLLKSGAARIRDRLKSAVETAVKMCEQRFKQELQEDKGAFDRLENYHAQLKLKMDKRTEQERCLQTEWTEYRRHYVELCKEAGGYSKDQVRDKIQYLADRIESQEKTLDATEKEIDRIQEELRKARQVVEKAVIDNPQKYNAIQEWRKELK